MTQPKQHKFNPARSIIILLISLLFLHACQVKRVVAGNQFNLPPATLLTSVNFTLLSGGIVILNATVGDFDDTLNFVLDTGSGGISLDSNTVEYMKLEKVKTSRTIRGIGGIRTISFVMGQTLHLTGLDVKFLDFHINDYDLLSSVYGLKIDGIIGYSFFSRYIIKLNYDKHVMEVWQPGSMTYPAGGFLMRPNIRNIPIMEGAVKDATLVSGSFYMDTGAGLSLLLSEQFVKDSSFLKLNKKFTKTQAEGLGGKAPMRLTTIKQVRVGPYKFRKVPVHIFEDEYNITAYPLLGGLIGNDILRRFNLVMNYPEKEIHLMPNKSLHDAFDYSYTGLGIYKMNGLVIIEDVLEDSPGEKAGLMPGDIILGVGPNFSNNIQAYKSLMQHEGKIKITVLRNGDALQFTMMIKSILK